MITRRELRRALRKLTDADWTIAERTRQVRTVRGSNVATAVAEAHLEQRQFTTTLHRDLPIGRGSAQSTFSADSFSSQKVIAELAQACTEQVQPPWRMAPPSAAAQVQLDDRPQRQTTTLADAISALQTAAATATAGRLQWQISMGNDAMVVETSTGNEVRWTATDYEIVLTAQRSGHRLETRRCARRRQDINPSQLCSELDQEFTRLGSASATPRGRIDMVLDRDAMLFDGDLGVWHVLAEQANVQRLTRGVSRLPTAIPNSMLRVISNGARNFGWRSAPVADDGAPVRRFVLIANGALATRGSSVIDAGRSNENGLATANGGVRNLDVSDNGPAWQPPASYLEIHRFEAPRLDLASGELTALIASATWHRGASSGDSARATAVTGGAIRVDLVNALLAGRLRGAALTTPSYQGPRQIVLGPSTVW